MHPHLHRKDNMACEEVMTALEECHARGFLWKALGNCSKIKDQVTLCLRAERTKHAAANREAARARREKYKKGWAEIEKNS